MPTGPWAVEEQAACKLKNPRFTNKQEYCPMNLLDTDPLKGLLDMRLGGATSSSNTKAPDSDLMDVVLSVQSHENLFLDRVTVPTAPGGGGESRCT